MADKELTIFVVDLAAPKSPLSYLFHTFAGKLLKGLKTDLLSVVLFHSQETSHASASSGKFKGIDVVMDFEQASYDRLKQLHHKLMLEDAKPDLSPECSDMIQSVLFSTTLLAPTKGKAFTRNIVLISTAESPLNPDSLEKIAALPKFLQSMPVNMYSIVSDLLPDNAQEVRQMKEFFTKFQLYSASEMESILQNCPPMKKTRPVSVFKGVLRLGADYSKIINDSGYIPEQDSTCLTWNIDVYPAAKNETSSSGAHEYLIDDGSIVKLERNTKHFVWVKNFQGERIEDDEEEVEKNDKQFDKVSVEAGQFTPGFKFSNFDLVALDSDLKEAATLKLTAGLDILGFVDVESIPIAFLNGEALFVVPEKDSTLRNITNHNAFCISLLEEKKAILARFVRKAAKEVEVGILFPTQVKDNENKAHSFIFIRLPFKEDVKVGNFIKLSGKEALEKNGDKSTDLESINALMEEFIEAKTFPEKELKLNEQMIISNQKAIMKSSESSKLSIRGTQAPTDNFYSSDPGVNKYSINVRKLLLKSLDYEDSIKFYEDSEAVSKSLSESQETNLFNLENAMKVNSSFSDPNIFLKLAQNGLLASKRLAEKIGSSYVRKEDVKKRKQATDQKFEARGNYGAEEKDYDTVPDFGL